MASKKSDSEKKLDAAVKAGRIEYAASDEIDDYDEIGAEFLYKIFGIKAYMITDLSSLGDFAGCCLPDDVAEDVDYETAMDIARDIMCKRILNEYGIMVQSDDTLLFVFEEIRKIRSRMTQ